MYHTIFHPLAISSHKSDVIRILPRPFIKIKSNEEFLDNCSYLRMMEYQTTKYCEYAISIKVASGKQIVLN
jgi:hypothetical protein